MTFLPIVARELRVASRRRSTYFVRAGAALLVIAAGTWLFLMMHRQTSSREMAMVLFGTLTGSAVLYCLLSGVRSTADCLSQEKREGTLGLLFLTDLNGLDVVLGKLAASSLNALYGVLAVVPMLAIPLLMGGVTLGEFGRTALVAVNTLFFSLAVGLCVSAGSHSARKAVGMTFLLILIITAVIPACGAWIAYVSKARLVRALSLIPSPGFTYYVAWDSTYRVWRNQFWWSLLVIHGLGWIFLALASVIVPRAWQDRPAGAQRLRWRERWQSWSYGGLVERRAFRNQLLDQNAFFWLAARARLKPACVWGVLGLMACAWVLGLARFHRDWLNQGTYLATGVLLNMLIKGWFAVEAGRQLAEDRKDGALELLLSTPLRVRDILRGQSLALRRQFLGPVVAVLFVETLLMLAASGDPEIASEREDHALWVCLWTGSMVMLVADLVALYWVGMWQGLAAKNPSRAPSGSLTRVVILPCLAYALVLLVAALASIREAPGWRFYLGCWFGLSMAADFGFGRLARQKLLSEFRLAAAQRYAPRLGFWKRWLAGAEPERALAEGVGPTRGWNLKC